jgi:peptide/nickel transport system permease protein
MGSMWRYLLKRLLLGIPLLIGITAMSFFLMKMAPGDPLAHMMDPSINPDMLIQIRQNLGLDLPWYRQYFHWLRALLSGNMGYSMLTGQSVSETLVSRLPATLGLSLASLLVTLVGGTIWGLFTAWKSPHWVEKSLSFLAILCLSLPTFWLGMVLIIVFSLQLDWFPSSGMNDPLLYGQPFGLRWQNTLWHAVLPVTALSIGSMAAISRYVRYEAGSLFRQPFVLVARARGLSERRVTYHVWRNSLLPMITLLGLELPGLVSGAYLIEYIFSWPGMGQVLLSAVFARDYPVMMGGLLMTAVLIVLGSLLADLLYRVADPRIGKSV